MKLPLALLAAALLVPLALPASSAQAPPADDAVRLLEDKGGDVKLSAAASEQDPAGRWAAADLRSLDVREEPDQVTFILAVGSLAADPEAPFAENVQYGILFRHLDQAYRVRIDHRTFVGSSSFGALEVYDPVRQEYDQVGPFQEATQDMAAGTLAFTVGRDLLLDREGDAPHPEVPLTDWQATAAGNPVFGARMRDFCPAGPTSCAQPLPAAHDAMPDQGNGTTPLVPRFGIAQSGHARLLSQVPTRASNGEATTIVYQVQAVNRGPRNATFSLAASGVPAGWEVRLPAARLTVPGNGSVALPILLSVPFTHEHGTYQKFLLEMRGQADPGSVGRIQLGIRYSNPPQPAGHHNTLWLHTAAVPSPTGNPALDTLLEGSGGLYMNALDTDPLDALADVPGFSCGTNVVPPQQSYCWDVPLRPQLELGLDFSLQRTGTISVPIKTALPLLGATLQGALRHLAPGQVREFFGDDPSVVLARVVPRAAVDVQPNSEGTLLSADIVATREGDFVPYQKGAQLHLDLELVATVAQAVNLFGGDATTPAIQPGGLLTDLPLNEYHDAVAQVFASNATLQLLAAGPQDRATNPGKTLLFNLTLQNDGAAGRFNLELTGIHLPWARIVAPGEQVRLDSGESVPVRIAVAVPATADKGDTADLVLTATSASDLNVRSLARLFATVDTDKEYPDEAALVAPAAEAARQRTPGAGALLLAPCVVALAALCRRRAPSAPPSGRR